MLTNLFISWSVHLLIPSPFYFSISLSIHLLIYSTTHLSISSFLCLPLKPPLEISLRDNSQRNLQTIDKREPTVSSPLSLSLLPSSSTLPIACSIWLIWLNYAISLACTELSFWLTNHLAIKCLQFAGVGDAGGNRRHLLSAWNRRRMKAEQER